MKIVLLEMGLVDVYQNVCVVPLLPCLPRYFVVPPACLYIISPLFCLGNKISDDQSHYLTDFESPSSSRYHSLSKHKKRTNRLLLCRHIGNASIAYSTVE